MMDMKILKVIAIAICACIYSTQAYAETNSDEDVSVSTPKAPEGTNKLAAEATGVTEDALKCKQKSDDEMVKCMNLGMKNNVEGYVGKCSAEADAREANCHGS